MDSVARGTVINLLTRTASVVLVLGITAFTARLGTEQQGAFALFTSVEGVLLALLSGFGIALARRISHHGEEPRALLSAMVIGLIGLGALCGALLWIASRTGPAAYSTLWLLALAAPVLLLAPNLAGLWLGEGRMAPMAALSITPPLLTLLGLGALSAAFAQPAVVQVLGAWVGAKVVVGVVLLVLLWRGARLARPDFAALKREALFIATIGGTNLIGLLNYRVGLFAIERLLGLSSVGVYSIAVVMAELLWFVSGSLTQAVYSRIGTPDRGQAAATTIRVVHLSLLALVMVSPLLVVAAAWLVPVVLGPAYAGSLALLLWLLPGVLLFGGASALSAYFTNHAGAPRVPAQVAALSLAVNAAGCALLVPRLGMTGAAIAASAAYSTTVLTLAWRFVRHAGLPLSRILVPDAKQLRADLQRLRSRRGG